MKPYDDSNGIIYWDIPFAAGTLTCEGLDNDGKAQSQYSITTSGRPYKITATVDKTELTGEGSVAHVTIQIKDENDVLVRLADNEVTCRVFGAGRLLGLEGSNNSDMGDYTDNRQRVHNGQLLAYITNRGHGEIRISLSSPLLESAELVLQSK